jgi:molybdate transport system substrate-binding protein
VVGPLPPAIQITTTFSAGIGAASTRVEATRALLAFMASPETAEAKHRQGMSPV